MVHHLNAMTLWAFDIILRVPISVTKQDFRFIGCLLLIIASMFLLSSEASHIVRFSEPEFCSNHYLLSNRIAVSCIPIQPEPSCCELLVPALNSKGCVFKLMNDGTKLNNFLWACIFPCIFFSSNFLHRV